MIMESLRTLICASGKALLQLFVLLPAMTLFEAASAQEMEPVLAFPQPGLDDTSTYRGYMTRFFRDHEGNAVQVSLNHNHGRIVNLWADAANESISFTARDADSRPAKLIWGSERAAARGEGKTRQLEYLLTSPSTAIDIGHFLLCSMRKERDFQYFEKHLLPFESAPYLENEYTELLENLARLPAAERARHLALFSAKNVEDLRARLQPSINSSVRGSSWVVTIKQPTFDGKNLLVLELGADQAQATARVIANKVSIRGRDHQPLQLRVKISTDSPALTPLTRDKIFNQDFFHFYAWARAQHDSALQKATAQKSVSAGEGNASGPKERLRFPWLERQIRSVELLSYQEKLMAGLPNYATYFGRDMMMSALMMEPIWSPAMLEHVIASVLRKLSPAGEVSHEEALGGQAIRENAAAYNTLLEKYFNDGPQNNSRSDSLLAPVRALLENLQAVRENYRMLDDDFQLPVLAGRYLSRRDLSPQRQREFLGALAAKDRKETRLALLLKNLWHIARLTQAYVAEPVATNLVGFSRLDEKRWLPGSWRDSNAGYANGRFAMDINAVWVPMALEAMHTILPKLRELGFGPADFEAMVPETRDPPLRQYMDQPESLPRAVAVWRGARKHFEVELDPQQTEQRVKAKLNWLPEPEKAYWNTVLSQSQAAKNGIEFLALALDAEGQATPVVNTDPATMLFLKNFTADILAGEATPAGVLKLVNVLVLPYPVGLFVESSGPLVANDAYASSEVWESFKRDHYHSPRVVWGREVNLVLLGLSKQMLAAYDDQGRMKSPMLVTYVHELRQALHTIAAAVEASGLKHNELWSYKIENGKLFPSRYPASCDIQLWNLTDLAVQHALARMAKL